MSSTLPLQPSLEHLKKQAKDLLRAHQLGDAAVCSTLRYLRHLAQASEGDILTAPLTLRQAQHALAKQYGFTSWANLKAAVGAAKAVDAIIGGCFCGKVRYQIDDPPTNVTACHCTGCRRASGAPAVAWITVNAESFRLVRGELRLVRAPEPEPGTCDGFGGVRGFCAQCGTHITFVDDNRQHEVDVTTGSLENPDRFPPTQDYGTEKKLTWMKTLAQ